MNKPEGCVFCSELESVDHLFFKCIVAKLIWKDISKFLGFAIGDDLSSVIHYWVANSRHAALNSICSAVFWSIWTLRNDIVFNGVTWISMKHIWWCISRTIKRWECLIKASMTALVESFYQHFHQELLLPLMIEQG